jgi:hypothetical protein
MDEILGRIHEIQKDKVIYDDIWWYCDECEKAIDEG